MEKKNQHNTKTKAKNCGILLCLYRNNESEEILKVITFDVLRHFLLHF